MLLSEKIHNPSGDPGRYWFVMIGPNLVRAAVFDGRGRQPSFRVHLYIYVIICLQNSLVWNDFPSKFIFASAVIENCVLLLAENDIRAKMD